MTDSPTEARSVTVEREFPYPPEKLWRALTQSHLIAEWLMQNDFRPDAGHRFSLSAEWGTVDCKVLVIEPNEKLSYTWEALGVETIVTWTLTPTAEGTVLRMEQVGFKPDQEQAYRGATFGWRKYFGNLEQLLARTD